MRSPRAPVRALLRALLLLVLVALAGAGAAAFYAYQRFDAPGPLAQATPVVVPRGGIEQVSEALAAQGVVQRASDLRLAALATRAPIRAGELEFPAHASLRQVLGVLRAGRPVQHKVTIPEGLTAAQVALLLERTEPLVGEAEVVEEGSLLPETYQFERGTGRAQIQERAKAAMDRALERVWNGRAENLPLATPRDAVILASIVERETARPEERARVAAVYLNRLRLGMKLQSDPTVVYAVSGGLGVLDHPLTRAELDRDDPYNTYRRPGLPPGPIAMPGLASLRAAVQPAASDELYFVADGTGGHVFARTEEEHRRNVARWREIERTRRASAPGASAPAPGMSAPGVPVPVVPGPTLLAPAAPVTAVPAPAAPAPRAAAVPAPPLSVPPPPAP